MTDHIEAPRRLFLFRGRLVAAVIGSALIAGVGAYLLIDRAVATPPPFNQVAAVDEVRAALRLGKPTVVEFGANACATCRDMKPVLEALRREHGERITVIDVDIVKQREYIGRYRIQLMPTQVFFDAQGREIERNLGKISAGDILAKLGVAPGGPAQ
jgi:thioredoxin 1